MLNLIYGGLAVVVGAFGLLCRAGALESRPTTGKDIDHD